MFCKYCGSEIKDNDSFCGVCGNPVEKIVVNRYNSSLPLEKVCFVVLHIMPFILVLAELTGKVGAYFNLVFPIIIALCDGYFLSKKGIRGYWKIWGIFFLPVYVFIRAKKTDKRYGWTIAYSILFILSVAIFVFMPLNEKNKYEWEIDGFSSVQSNKVTSINLEDYIPAIGNKYIYNDYVGDNEESYIELTLDSADYGGDGTVLFEKRYLLAPVGMTSNGSYFYDSEQECVYKITSTDNNGKNIAPIMIPINKSTSYGESISISSPPNLFTVLTKAGEFKDCLCIVKEDQESNEVGITIFFYAPKVGLVLVENKGSLVKRLYGTDEYVVTTELIEMVKQ